MSGFRTIVENLTGAFELMLGRPEGLDRIDTSVEGFWRSFAAIILLAPFSYLSLASQFSIEAADSTAGAASSSLTGSRLAISTIALLVDWIAFPLVFALLARPFGLGARYVPFITARNWASVVIGALVSVLHILHLVGILPASAMPYIMLVTIFVALRFSYVVAKITLAVSVAMALPIVILDLLVSLMIWSAFERLL